MSELNNWLASGRDYAKQNGWSHASSEVITEKNKAKNIEVKNSLAKFKRKEDIVVVRSMGHDEYIELLKEARNEKVHAFKRFKSTTPFHGSYGNEYNIEYYVPKEVEGAYFGNKASQYETEKEFLISEGQKYRVKFNDEGLSVYVYPNS